LTYSLRLSVYFEYLYGYWCHAIINGIFNVLLSIIYYPIIILKYLLNYLISAVYQFSLMGYRTSVYIIKGFFDKITERLKIPKEVEKKIEKEIEKEVDIKEGKIDKREQIKQLENVFLKISKNVQNQNNIVEEIDKMFFEDTKNSIKNLNNLMENNAVNGINQKSNINQKKGGNNNVNILVATSPPISIDIKKSLDLIGEALFSVRFQESFNFMDTEELNKLKTNIVNNNEFYGIEKDKIINEFIKMITNKFQEDDYFKNIKDKFKKIDELNYVLEYKNIFYNYVKYVKINKSKNNIEDLTKIIKSNNKKIGYHLDNFTESTEIYFTKNNIIAISMALLSIAFVIGYFLNISTEKIENNAEKNILTKKEIDKIEKNIDKKMEKMNPKELNSSKTKSK